MNENEPAYKSHPLRITILTSNNHFVWSSEESDETELSIKNDVTIGSSITVNGKDMTIEKMYLNKSTRGWVLLIETE